jgi:RND family efflux transporter MFP subunit
MKKKKRWIWFLLGAVVLAGGIAAARGKGKGDGKPEEPPFRLGKVAQEALQVSVREVGVVDPEKKVDVKSTVSGRVVTIALREGAVVRRGDLLATIEPDVNQAQTLSGVQTDVKDAELKLMDADRELNNQKSLFENGLIGQDAYRASEIKRDQAAQTLASARQRYQIVEDRGIPISGNAASQVARVTSPMDGVVITRGIELGQTVTSGVSSFNEGTVLFTVADLKTLLIKVNLNEVDIAKVAMGQPVRVTLDAYPQKVFTGKVRFVAPAAKLVEKIKVFEIEVALDELSESFRTGMSANVEILGEKRDKALSIPLEALQKSEGATVAYVLKENLPAEKVASAKEGLSGRNKFFWLSEHWKEYFDAVPVKAGIATLEKVEVLGGLKAGQQVALEDPTKKKVERDEDD